MFFSITALLAASAATVSAAAVKRTTTISVTPHEQYSSSVGILGCKVNTNRFAYWPSAVDCNNICVQVTNAGRSVYLIKGDQSGGAYDVSYDAWNYLVSGQSATVSPQTGGGVNMEYQFVSPSNCQSLLTAGTLPLSGANSMNFLASCLSQPSSWVAQNYKLYNLLDPLCKYGYDEACTLNLAVSNQPTCPHQLGVPNTPTGDHVYDVQYGTGIVYAAS